MKYDVSKAQVGDKIYGMEFEGLVEEYEVYLPPYANIDDASEVTYWIRGNGISTTLRDDHAWFTTYNEAAIECARHGFKVIEEYKKQIDDNDIGSLVRFAYDMFLAENRPRLNEFRKGIVRSLIQEKMRRFGMWRN